MNKVHVSTCHRALTKVNTGWDPSKAQGEEKEDGQALGVDRPRALTSLGRRLGPNQRALTSDGRHLPIPTGRNDRGGGGTIGHAHR